ncbi:MAG: flagellar FlbD family protein [Lachnospiraceae bacterium]|nr:flagellar FlbD family protein [Lachnospiraceae bacterium]MDE7031539.1 flagellar FlbD family protein [Lachnospiraceae bacterium]
MIEVTKINGVKILINTNLIETVEETPDTVVTLTDGKKVIIKESRHEVKNLVKLTRQEYFKEILNAESLIKAADETNSQ